MSPVSLGCKNTLEPSPCVPLCLLDAVVDRFGTKDIHYAKSDERHFTITAKVEISNQFFGWLLGFGKKVQIISPPEVREEFAVYLDKIREMY